MISQSRLGILLIFFECKTGIGWSPAVSHIYKYKCHLHSSQIFKKFQINPLPRKEFSMPLPCPPAQWGNARCFLKIMNRQLLVEISLLPSKHQTYQWNMAERQNCWFDTFGDNNLDWSAEKKSYSRASSMNWSKYWTENTGSRSSLVATMEMILMMRMVMKSTWDKAWALRQQSWCQRRRSCLQWGRPLARMPHGSCWFPPGGWLFNILIVTIITWLPETLKIPWWWSP